MRLLQVLLLNMLAVKQASDGSYDLGPEPMNDNEVSTGPRRYWALPPMLAPRGLNRQASAAYVGVSPTKFDQLVNDKRMPKPKRVDGRRLWDRIALDAAFSALPDEGDYVQSQAWDVVP